MSRVVLLVNRAAGGSQRGDDPMETAAMVRKIFEQAGHEISFKALGPEEIDTALGQAIADRPDTILIAGGDGTVSAAARMLGGTGIAMGILPMGTFNLAARDLGIPLDLAEAARFLATAEPHAIDVLDVAGRICLCALILGFYPEFSNVFEKRDHGGRWWKKTFKLLTHFRSAFLLARPLPLAWQSDGGDGRARTKFSAFVPGHYRQSAGLIPIRTGFRSGNLTAYIGTQRAPAAALRGIASYALGLQEKDPDLKIVKATRMILHASGRSGCRAMLDGEIVKLSFPLEMKIISTHLTVLTTAAIAAENAITS